MKNIILATISVVILLMATTLEAKRVRIGNSNNCVKSENVTATVSFNGQVEKASEVKDLLDKKEREVFALAQEIGLADIKMNSQYFNINYNNNNYGNGGYTYSGNMSFKLTDYANALILLDKLQENKYQTSLSVNRQMNQNCR